MRALVSNSACLPAAYGLSAVPNNLPSAVALPPQQATQPSSTPLWSQLQTPDMQAEPEPAEHRNVKIDNDLPAQRVSRGNLRSRRLCYLTNTA